MVQRPEILNGLKNFFTFFAAVGPKKYLNWAIWAENPGYFSHTTDNYSEDNASDRLLFSTFTLSVLLVFLMLNRTPLAPNNSVQIFCSAINS